MKIRFSHTQTFLDATIDWIVISSEVIDAREQAYSIN